MKKRLQYEAMERQEYRNLYFLKILDGEDNFDWEKRSERSLLTFDDNALVSFFFFFFV